jgi:hypothetical protein
MKEQRNPFLLRTSEYIDADPTFVRFFGPGTLELLSTERPLINRVLFSAPGGGKTSLMRLFTPGPLLELHKNQQLDGYDDLYDIMRKFGMLGEDGPKLLGIPLPIDLGYASLADIGLDPAKQMRLLFALLDARLILSTLRHAQILRRVPLGESLPRFKLLAPNNPVELPGLAFPCNGEELYNWAMRREEEICGVLDSFDPGNLAPPRTEGLAILDLFKPDTFLFDDKPVADHILFMLDDVQHMTSLQRDRLLDFILTKRSTTPIWLAERLEALNRNELLQLGSIKGREYDPVFLEGYWRDHQKRFEAVVSSIAERRARASRALEVSNFNSCLESELEGEKWEARLQDALQKVAARVRARAAGRQLFDAWVREREAFAGPTLDRLVAWRELEILIERELNKKQASLGIPLESSELEDKLDNSLRSAAMLFIANEFDLPFYFGPSTLAKLSTFNIQQYLGLAAKMFEEVIAAALINPQQQPMLSAVRQEDILQKASREMWEEIPRRSTHGTKVRGLLEAIAAFSRWYTEKPTAPNDPGVNAIAITMADLAKLRDPEWLRLRPDHAMLADVLASALAHNYLDAQPDSKCKGQFWCVFNLNRLLCVKYRLHLNYGKFKEQSMETLVRWMNKGFESRRDAGEDLL